MNMTIKEFRKNMIQVITSNYPMFGHKLFKIEFIEDSNIKTASTNGEIIKFNMLFVNSLSHDERITLVCHELCHIIFLHFLRIGNKDLDLWNVATDYSINLILKSMKFKINKNWLCDDKFIGLSAESIYNILLKKGNNQNDIEQSKKSGSFTKPKDKNGNDLSDEEIENLKNEGEKELQKSVNQMIRQEKAIKNSETLTEKMKSDKLETLKTVSSQFTKYLDDIQENRIDWKYILDDFLSDINYSDFNMFRPDDQMNDSTEFFMPAIEKLETGKIGLALDCSGSLSFFSEQVASEVFHCMKQYEKDTLDVFYIDSKLIKHIELSNESQIEQIDGCLTDFKSFFNQDLKNYPDIEYLIFLTDGYVDITNWSIPDCKVLWLLTCENKRFEKFVPFGECKRIIL